MTRNQIEYVSHLETVRHNEAMEAETNRHNLVGEAQGWDDVNSRRVQANASMWQAESASRNATASLMNANTNLYNAETNRQKVENDVTRVDFSMPGFSFTGSITGLHQYVAQPLGGWIYDHVINPEPTTVEKLAGAWDALKSDVKSYGKQLIQNIADIPLGPTNAQKVVKGTTKRGNKKR